MVRKKEPDIRCARERGALAAAAAVLRRGGVVAFPTETVYGLGVNYGKCAARRRLTRVKRRPAGQPFQLLASSRRRAAMIHGPLPPEAASLARAFWPGPLTLVVKDRRGRWVGLRVPDHPTARDLARRAGGLLVATSANISGERPALTAEAVLKAFGNDVDFVLDGGRVGLGVSSTVVRVCVDGWEVLREGAIATREIEAAFTGPARKKGGRT